MRLPVAASTPLDGELGPLGCQNWILEHDEPRDQEDAGLFGLSNELRRIVEVADCADLFR